MAVININIYFISKSLIDNKINQTLTVVMNNLRTFYFQLMEIILHNIIKIK